MPKHALLWVGLIVAIIVAGAALMYAFRPAAAIERSLNNLSQASTADFSTRLLLTNSTTTKQLLGEEANVDVDINGMWERQEGPDNIVTDVNLTTKSESVSFTVQGKVRLIKDKLYMLVEKTPQAFPPLVQLKDQWIVSDRGEAEETTTPLIVTRDMFTSIERVGVEEIGDTATVHYAAQATDAALIHLMDSLAGVLGTTLSEDQINQIRSSVAQVEAVPIDLWIERWGSELKQLRTTLAVPGGNTMHFTIRFNQLNQPVTVTTPDNARTLQEIIAANAQPEQN